MPAHRSALARSRKIALGAAALAAVSLYGVLATPEGSGLAARTQSNAASTPGTLDGPYTHGNLSLYVVRGGSDDRRTYLTLDQGLAARTVEVREQGAAAGQDQAQVNSLEIENKSDKWLFLQAGDIVKGGKQDRTIMTDMVLAPHSKPQAIDAFCVEHGRWTPTQDGLAFKANPGIVAGGSLKRAIQSEKNQSRVWQEVARTETAAVAVAAPASVDGAREMRLSSTGTYNAIAENKALNDRRTAYVNALLPSIRKHKDAIGLAMAINGTMAAADVYASSALFDALSRKLVESYALEALLARPDGKHAAPGKDQVTAFLASTASAPEATETIGESMHRSTRETQAAVMYEYGLVATAKGEKRQSLHKSYLKK